MTASELMYQVNSLYKIYKIYVHSTAESRTDDLIRF